MQAFSRLAFDPLTPWPLLWGLAAVALALWVVYVVLRGRAWLMRALGLSILALALANPIWVQEEREPLKDIVALVVDRSESMDFRGRTETSEAAYQRIKAQLESDPDIELRIAETDPDADGTDIFTALQSALSDAPRDRIAGSILITDGQVQDAPEDPASAESMGPIHALIVGGEEETDRRIEIQSAPSFGIMDSQVELRVRVDDPSVSAVDVDISVNGEPQRSQRVAVGEPVTLKVELERRGDNLVVLQVPAIPDELTLANNLASANVSGVQDRLRVLLVTGEPHAGARVWRDLLKSDPSVDLVHFTILRPPQKTDGTPTEEIALISFPRAQLFRDKLDEFDLVIFDHELRAGVLEDSYLERVARYVERGGALLVAAGPTYPDSAMLYQTPLVSVLPGRATGEIVTRTFVPELAPLGKRHSVTAPLAQGQQQWGPWMRYMKVEPGRADVVLQSPDGGPLLLLDRVGEGRVAAVMSDQIWLWARGYKGGGPYAELMRRTAHWLMQEPELEEEFLQLTTTGADVAAELRTLTDAPPPLTLATPGGETREAEWSLVSPGRYSSRFASGDLGLYTAASGELAAVALRGPTHPREYADLRATPEKLQPVATATLGGVFRLGASGQPDMPEIRRVGTRGNAAGSNWLGLRERDAYAVRSTESTNLLPGVVGMALAVLFRHRARRRQHPLQRIRLWGEVADQHPVLVDRTRQLEAPDARLLEAGAAVVGLVAHQDHGLVAQPRARLDRLLHEPEGDPVAPPPLGHRQWAQQGETGGAARRHRP
jgi:hypothetical protein